MIKNLILIFLVLVTGVFAMAPLASADTKSAIQCGVNSAAGAGNGDCSANTAAPQDFNDLLTKIIDILSVLVGAVAVIMLIVAGFRFVSSAGSETAVAGARKTVLYALIGLVLVAIAQTIVHFVLNNITTKS